MQIKVDPGTEKYIKLAKQKLQTLRRLRHDLNLPAMNKYFQPESEVMIRVKSTEWEEYIYITGGNPPFMFQMSQLNQYKTYDRTVKLITTFDLDTAFSNITQPPVFSLPYTVGSGYIVGVKYLGSNTYEYDTLPISSKGKPSQSGRNIYNHVIPIAADLFPTGTVGVSVSGINFTAPGTAAMSVFKPDGATDYTVTVIPSDLSFSTIGGAEPTYTIKNNHTDLLAVIHRGYFLDPVSSLTVGFGYFTISDSAGLIFTKLSEGTGTGIYNHYMEGDTATASTADIWGIAFNRSNIILGIGPSWTYDVNTLVYKNGVLKNTIFIASFFTFGDFALPDLPGSINIRVMLTCADGTEVAFCLDTTTDSVVYVVDSAGVRTVVVSKPIASTVTILGFSDDKRMLIILDADGLSYYYKDDVGVWSSIYTDPFVFNPILLPFFKSSTSDLFVENTNVNIFTSYKLDQDTLTVTKTEHHRDPSLFSLASEPNVFIDKV